MVLLGIDIGTTHSKAGLFDLDGTALAIASRETVVHRSPEGYAYYDPEEMWQTVSAVIQEITRQLPEKRVCAIGITSMAESGLFIDRRTGAQRSPFLPWFDPCSQAQASFIAEESDEFERFCKSGLHNSFKLGLAKILWIREQDPDALKDAVWLSASSYIAYRLTGQLAFDYSLAARTYAFRIDEKTWDREWLRHFRLCPDIFPDVYPGGTIMGTVSSEFTSIGLKAGTPVTIAGHDHVSAALAVGAIEPDIIYDSMGTAETLVGTLNVRRLGRTEFESGLSYGHHIAQGRYFWMGGNSSSGGSIEWIRRQLGDEALQYEDILALLEQTKAGATGILYFPYLSGSGAPRPNPLAKASFIGLTNEHGRADIVKAVIEGTAYQLESIRRAAERIIEQSIHKMIVVGGGTRNPHWLQVKADVTNCILEVPPIPEASLLGAALAAGVGYGIYSSMDEAVASIARHESKRIHPDPEHHEDYCHLFESGYMKLQAPLNEFFNRV